MVTTGRQPSAGGKNLLEIAKFLCTLATMKAERFRAGGIISGRLLTISEQS